MTMIATAAAAAAAAGGDNDNDTSTDLAFATLKEACDGHRRPDEDQGTDDRCGKAACGEAGEVALGIAAVAFELDIGGGGSGGSGGGGSRVTFFTRPRRRNTIVSLLFRRTRFCHRTSNPGLQDPEIAMIEGCDDVVCSYIMFGTSKHTDSYMRNNNLRGRLRIAKFATPC